METWSLSWSKLIDFNDNQVNKLSDGMVGVFRLSKEEGDKKLVFFVGSSENIKKELLSYLSDGAPNECVQATLSSYKCYFRYSLIGDPEVRNAALKKMFRVYQPSCNTEEPGGREDIDLNLNP